MQNIHLKITTSHEDNEMTENSDKALENFDTAEVDSDKKKISWIELFKTPNLRGNTIRINIIW